jgi:predicted 2-oxoglutarate/Fe(II)-dependent dioxygenase YbiX
MIYIERGFLDPAACERIRRAMDAGEPEEAEVLDTSIDRRDDIRRAEVIDVEATVIDQVETRLDSRREAVARFFGLELSGREGAGFVRYRPGGFYTAHRDRADLPSWPAATRRAVALVAFLNGSRDVEPDGEFVGGILRLFVNEGAMDVQPRRGQLVAFPADVLHEVTEVIGGTRDAIVDWFYS